MKDRILLTVQKSMEKTTWDVRVSNWYYALQRTNIAHLGERNIIFKHGLGRGYASSQEGKSLGKEATNLNLVTTGFLNRQAAWNSVAIEEQLHFLVISRLLERRN